MRACALYIIAYEDTQINRTKNDFICIYFLLILIKQDVVAACEIVNCNGVEVQCQVLLFFFLIRFQLLLNGWEASRHKVPCRLYSMDLLTVCFG